MAYLRVLVSVPTAVSAKLIASQENGEMWCIREGRGDNDVRGSEVGKVERE